MKLTQLWASTATLLLKLSIATAGVQVDLRFEDGSKTKPATAGVHTVEVWARLFGSNSTGLDESLMYVYGSVQSEQRNGGAILPGSSGITANAAIAPRFTLTLPFGTPGIASNSSADGVQDWGDPRDVRQLIKYNMEVAELLPHESHATYIGYGLSGITANLINEGEPSAGVELKMGELEITINSSDLALNNHGGVTQFNWTKHSSVIPPSQLHRIDGPTGKVGDRHYLDSIAGIPGNSIGFVMNPEPGSATLLLCLTVLAAMRRERGKQRSSPAI